jgi:hypothetical protein
MMDDVTFMNLEPFSFPQKIPSFAIFLSLIYTFAQQELITK